MENVYPECRFALKEWAVVEKALSKGKQALLLRNGGLIDAPLGFKAEHSSFYIYPTFHHQQRDGIKKEFEGLLRDISLDSEPGEVSLSLYAEVLKAVRVERAEKLERLDSFHIFNAAEVERRFFYGRQKGIQAGINVLLLKVYKLKEPVRLPVLPHYSGCRSWIDLGFALKGRNGLPVKGPLPNLEDFPNI